MSPENKERLLVNIATLHRMASAWGISATGTIGAIWLKLPPEQQLAIIEVLPIPVWAVPLVLLTITLALRVWPQRKLAAIQAAKIAELPP